jgi:hypothetical protein
MTTDDAGMSHPGVFAYYSHWALPPNREPGTREHPFASRPRRDLEDRAAVDGQEEEGGEHLYGPRTLDGHVCRPQYFGNRPRGHFESCRRTRRPDRGTQ